MRGRRIGQLTTAELAARLRAHADADEAYLKTLNLTKLLGHAICHAVIDEHEIQATIPRVETTLPCYLKTYITDQKHVSAIERYVIAASKLYHRGSIILNLVAQRICGERLPGARDITVTVRRPRFSLQDGVDGFRSFIDLIFGPDRVESSLLKHAFLPERWPSSTVPRCRQVDDVLEAKSAVLPALPTDWRGVFNGYVSGWDNPINRMMTKFCGNLQVHATSALHRSVRDYMGVVPLDASTARWLLIDAIFRPMRPIIAHDDDWQMAMTIRSILAPTDDAACEYVPSTPSFSKNALLLHLFLVRFGVAERSYLPVARRSRKYAYLDAWSAMRLLSRSTGSDKRTAEDEVTESLNIGQLLGLTPAAINARKKQLRAEVRRRIRHIVRNTQPGSSRRQRVNQARERRRRCGIGKISAAARIDSIETDGVGMRMCIKEPIGMAPYVVPVPEQSQVDKCRKRRPRQRKAKSDEGLSHEEVRTRLEARPITVGIDTGRAKLFTAAVSQNAVVKPATVMFRRSQYYHEMRHSVRTRWDRARQDEPTVRQAVEQLSEGSLRSCQMESWDTYLAAAKTHEQALDAEFVECRERAVWRMRAFRWRKASLDRAATRLMQTATVDANGKRLDASRPLVIGIGNAGFKSTGPGELAAPTSALSQALKRAIQRVRERGRRVHVYSLDEFRTTKCCCACGSETVPKPLRQHQRDETGNWLVRRWRLDENGEWRPTQKDVNSRRLRCCKRCSCAYTAKIRDRDVQAARNILWLAQAEHFGFERPEYLQRPKRQKACANVPGLHPE
jgi:hypothetical protein